MSGKSSPASSTMSSLSDDDDHIAEMVGNDRMYYVLSQFLETEDNKNIAMVLADLVHEVRELRKVVSSICPGTS